MKPTAPAPVRVELLDRPLPMFVRVLLVIFCALVPTMFATKHYVLRHDLSQLINFGAAFQARELPEVQALRPVIYPQDGYDGQFYAQIALDPTLRKPGLAGAIDNPIFRAQRITLPTLAYALGAGRPASVLFAYALLNLVFWYVLLAALLWWLRAATARDFLAVFAIMLTSGVLTSIQLSLTDLPAGVIGFLGLCAGEVSSVPLLATAILTKPSAGLFLIRYLIPLPGTARAWGKPAGLIALALTPMALWLVYIMHTLNTPLNDAQNIGIPFVAWCECAIQKCQNLFRAPFIFYFLYITPGEWLLFEFLTFVSLTVQAAMLLLRPFWRDPLSAVGALFAMLYFCLENAVLSGEQETARNLIPMTIAFNLILARKYRGPLFMALFVAGNVGLIYHFHQMLAFWLRPIGTH